MEILNTPSRALSGGVCETACGHLSGGYLRVAEEAQVQDSRNVPVNVLRQVRDRLEAGKIDEFLAPLQKLDAQMSWSVAGTSSRLDYFLFRLVFSRFRKCDVSLQAAESAIELITANGGTARQLEIAFKQELLPEFPKTNVAELEDQVVLVQFIAAHGLLEDQTIKKWAGETLGAALKALYWSTEGLIKGREKGPPPAAVAALVDLGATPKSEPPRWHRERDSVAYYLSSIPNPELAHAFYHAWHQQSDPAKNNTTAEQDNARAQPVDSNALLNVRAMLAQAETEFDASLYCEAESERALRKRQRLFDYTAVRYVPVSGEPKSGSYPWQGSVVGGPLFTSKSYPWPETKGYPDVPLVQFELDAISASTGISVGSGFLQVWRPVGFRTKDLQAAKLEVRVIPRHTVKRAKKLGRAPSKFVALSDHPDYSWRLCRAPAPIVIEDWKEFGYAVPDPELLTPEFLHLEARESEFFSTVIKTIEKAVHGHSLELFGFPQPAAAFLKLPKSWLPLATIRGPMDGAQCSSRTSGEPVRDITQVFFRHTKEQEFEYKSFSWRDFYGE